MLHDGGDGSEVLTVEEALELAGVGLFTAQLVVVCGLGWFCDTAWITVVISITIPVGYEFGGNDVLAGYLLSILFAAQGAGALIFGPVSDARGRSFAFAVTLLLSGVAGIGAALANSFGLLVTCIVVAGVGVGGNMPIDGALVAELAPKSIRGRLMTLLTVFWSLGSVIIYFVAWALIPSNTCATAQNATASCDSSDNQGWRYVLWVMTGMCFASLLLRLGFPESPSWLLAAGKEADALAVLHRIARMHGRQLPPALLRAGTLKLSSSANSEPAEPPLDEATALQCKRDGPGCCAVPAQLLALTKAPGMRTTLGLLAVLWFLSNLCASRATAARAANAARAAHAAHASSCYPPQSC